MIEMILSSCWSAFLMFIWFETNAFYEYLKFLPFLRAYEKKKSLYGNPRYSEFLAINHDNFISKLLSCPYCLGFWTSLVFCFILCPLVMLPVVYFCSLVLYFTIQKVLSLLQN